jgi:hypothetical protein
MQTSVRNFDRCHEELRGIGEVKKQWPISVPSNKDARKFFIDIFFLPWPFLGMLLADKVIYPIRELIDQRFSHRVCRAFV